MASAKSLVEKTKKLITNIDKSKSGPEPDWIKYVAMLTGVLAAVAGFLTVKSTNLTNDAIYESNQAILAQTQASDAWAEYEADSIKARIVETALLPSNTLNEEDRTALTKSDDDFRKSQPETKQKAITETAVRDDHLNKGLAHLAEKDLLSYGSLSVQLGIALASVAAMTRSRAVFVAGAFAGIAGILVTAYAFLPSLIH
jgi:hypothetical protein